MRFIRNDPWHKLTRQYLRINSTDAEKVLWDELKGKKLGVKFRRQYGFGTYIVDFFCPKLNLGIELDGEIHFSQKVKDDYRTKTMNLYDIEIIRFSNTEIICDMHAVLKRITQSIFELRSRYQVEV